LSNTKKAFAFRCSKNPWGKLLDGIRNLWVVRQK